MPETHLSPPSTDLKQYFRLDKAHLHPLFVLYLQFFSSLVTFNNMDWRVLLPIACAGLGCLLYLHRYRRALIFAIAWLITFAVIFLLLPSIANFGLRQFVRFSLFTYYIVVVLLPFGSILIYDTNISAIISSLVKLGLSRRFVLALSVVLRFLPTYGEESRLIRDNLKLRGIKLSIKRPVESWGYLFMPILLRLEHIAEELSSAAVTKGSESTTKRSAYQNLRFRPLEILIAFLYSGILIYCRYCV